MDAVAATVDIETVHLDRRYDFPVIRDRLAGYGLTDASIQPRKRPGGPRRQPLRFGLRWIVEATNSWWSNYGQLCRNIDRRIHYRHAALCLATSIRIVGKLFLARPMEPPIDPAFFIKLSGTA